MGGTYPVRSRFALAPHFCKASVASIINAWQLLSEFTTSNKPGGSCHECNIIRQGASGLEWGIEVKQVVEEHGKDTVFGVCIVGMYYTEGPVGQFKTLPTQNGTQRSPVTSCHVCAQALIRRHNSTPLSA